MNSFYVEKLIAITAIFEFLESLNVLEILKIAFKTYYIIQLTFRVVNQCLYLIKEDLLVSEEVKANSIPNVLEKLNWNHL